MRLTAQRFSGLTALSGRGLWYRPFGAMSFNAACRRLCAAKVYPHRYRGGAVKKCMNNTDITPPPVISTAAGQPPIGKPLIVQARGQLRLTWRLYAESPQSGEISLSHGMPQAACHHGAVIKKGCEEMMTISSQPFFKREYQMRIMLPAAKRRQ